MARYFHVSAVSDHQWLMSVDCPHNHSQPFWAGTIFGFKSDHGGTDLTGGFLRSHKDLLTFHIITQTSSRLHILSFLRRVLLWAMSRSSRVSKLFPSKHLHKRDVVMNLLSLEDLLPGLPVTDSLSESPCEELPFIFYILHSADT